MKQKPPETTTSPTGGWLEIVKKLSSHRKGVTQLGHEFPDSRNLIESNPALALCITCARSWDTLRDRSPDLIEYLLRTKRRHVCGLLGFPDTETMVRILAKITPEACSVPLLMKLRHPLKHSGLTEILRHIPIIDEASLLLAAHWRWNQFGTVSLFQELAAKCVNGKFSEFLRLLNDAESMELRGQLPGRSPRSISELHSLHDRLVRKINDAPDDELDWMLALQFPPPPIPGNEKIVPIDTPALLIEEGRKQHHCAVLRSFAVTMGETYLYRILEPERATLAIDRVADGWCIGELRGACNAEVMGETARMVHEWLKQHQRCAHRR